MKPKCRMLPTVAWSLNQTRAKKIKSKEREREWSISRNANHLPRNEYQTTEMNMKHNTQDCLWTKFNIKCKHCIFSRVFFSFSSVSHGYIGRVLICLYHFCSISSDMLDENMKQFSAIISVRISSLLLRRQIFLCVFHSGVHCVNSFNCQLDWKWSHEISEKYLNVLYYCNN